LQRVLVAALVLFPFAVHAESGADAWLRYERLAPSVMAQVRQSIPERVIALGTTEISEAARQELARGLRGMLGREPLPAGGPSSDGAIVLGTLDRIRRAIPQLDPGTLDAPDAYRVRATSSLRPKTTGASCTVRSRC